MRGLKGTKINLTVRREGAAELIDFTLVRDVIRVQSVKSRTLEPGYGYVRLAQFQERSDRDVQRALEKIAAEKGGIKVWCSTCVIIPADYLLKRCGYPICS